MKALLVASLVSSGLLFAEKALSEGTSNNRKIFGCWYLDQSGATLWSTEVRANSTDQAVAKAAVKGNLHLIGDSLFLPVSAGGAPSNIEVSVRCADSGLE